MARRTLRVNLRRRKRATIRPKRGGGGFGGDTLSDNFKPQESGVNFGTPTYGNTFVRPTTDTGLESAQANYTKQLGQLHQKYGTNKFDPNNPLSGFAGGYGQAGQDLQRDFGYDAKGDIDPTNNYSRASQLQTNFNQNKLGTFNSNAGKGNLYSTSSMADDAHVASGYEADKYNLKESYIKGIKGIVSARLAGEAELADYLAGAQSDFADRAAEYEGPEDVENTPAPYTRPNGKQTRALNIKLKKKRDKKRGRRR